MKTYHHEIEHISSLVKVQQKIDPKDYENIAQEEAY